MVFPRLMFLNLENNLIDTHLEIFRQFSPLFLKYLETRERINLDQRDLKAFMKRRRVPIPPCMTADKWQKMSLSEQYEAVFGAGDPSRQKLKDLPYYVRIVSRKRKQPSSRSSDESSAQVPTPNGKANQVTAANQVACIYCHRMQCKGCPLKFDDKITLKQVLEKAGVTTQPHFYYEENRQPPQPSSAKKTKNPVKNKKRGKKSGKSAKNGAQTISEKAAESESENFEFELLIQFNHQKCWALYSCLNRFIHYESSQYKGNEGENPGE